MSAPAESTALRGPVHLISSDSATLQSDLENAFWAPKPPTPDLGIGLLGCGWIAGLQLDAYRQAGFHVAALADRHPERAAHHALDYAPHAAVADTVDALVALPAVQVVDVATHVADRIETIRRTLDAGKPTLSQKPFVERLADGHDLATIACERGVPLAVNQNGRWAPHFGTMLSIVASGLIGDVLSADFWVEWAHDIMIAGKPAFETMPDLVLFDFGAHWFDLIGVLSGHAVLDVYAEVARRPTQSISAPLQADVLVSGSDFRANVRFRAGERIAEGSGYRVSGTRGVIEFRGEPLGGSSVRVFTESGQATVGIESDWFRWGLAGSMREFLLAAASGREPDHSAPSALRGLALAFAAGASARDGGRVQAGEAQCRIA